MSPPIHNRPPGSTRPTTVRRPDDTASPTTGGTGRARETGAVQGPRDTFGTEVGKAGDASSVLYATLQRVGVADLKTASGNVLQALHNAPLVETSPAIEESARSMVQAFVRDGVSDAPVRQLLDSLDTSNPEHTQALLQTVAARLEAVSDHVDAAGALDVVSRVLFESLDAPVAALQAARDLRPRGALAPYSVRANAGADMYSNEPGLNAMLEQLKADGAPKGAVVGVGGAVLDAASRLESSMIVAVDQDPRIIQGIEVVVGVLAHVDQTLGEDADKDQRLAAVVERLNGTVPRAQVSEELAAQGVSATTRANLKSLLESLNPGSQTSVRTRVAGDVWSRSGDAADRVEHLSNLAREGRIVAFAGDLSDPATSAHVTRLLEARGEDVGYFQLSNVLDWVPDARGLVDNIETLPFADHAVVATTTMLAEDGSLRLELAKELGSHTEPVARPAEEWFGDGGVGDRMHDRFWQAPQRRSHYQNVMTYFLEGEMNPTEVASLEKLQAYVGSKLDEELSAGWLSGFASQMVENSGLLGFVQELRLAQPEAGRPQEAITRHAEALDKKTRRQLPQLVDDYLDALVTPERNEKFLRFELEGLDVPDADIKRVASAASTVIELERGLVSLRRLADD